MERERLDCAICGARGVRLDTHIHEAVYGNVYDRKRRGEYTKQLIGFTPFDPVMSLFSRFGILSEGEGHGA